MGMDMLVWDMAVGCFALSVKVASTLSARAEVDG
jgi:hypothetical protein